MERDRAIIQGLIRHSNQNDEYNGAAFRAEFYRWSASRGFGLPGGDPVTGRPADTMPWARQESRVANIALAKFWSARTAALRQSMVPVLPGLQGHYTPKWEGA